MRFALFLNINAVNNSVDGSLFVQDGDNRDPNVAALDIPFGSFLGTGGSTFVDDSIFAAVDTSDNARTRLVTQESGDLPNRDNPGTFVISGRANPIPGYEHCTTCTFMDWGWWGTRVSVGPDGTPETAGQLEAQEYVHMGSWVAGDLTDAAELPNFGTATYAGTAIGTVLDTSVAGNPAAYIATGNMNMNVDFASRAGSFAITNFDGNMSAAGTLGVSTEAEDFATFDATLSGIGITGQAAGIFANDGTDIAKGVLGEFGLQDATRQAVGTFLGERN